MCIGGDEREEGWERVSERERVNEREREGSGLEQAAPPGQRQAGPQQVDSVCWWRGERGRLGESE